MLKHLHAGDRVKRRGHFLRQRLDADLAIFNAWRLRFQRVQARHAQGLGRQVNACHVGTLASHGVGQNAATTTHVEHAQTFQR